jgi:alkanesulfonate monooxygenase SsuD/methylene tetrahydromethanopterin reductase-like flavin-dependent oxidoreductase (luciferase family)
MRLGYFTMPMHPLHRHWSETLDEDREAVILADALGFHDAFIGEHLTDKVENITNSLLFLATLIHGTRTIKLATGTTNLSQMHPVLIASHAALFDHLAKGRFIMGISPGNLRTDAEALGTFDEDRGKLFAECIDVILEIWSREPPYEIDLPDNRFKVSTARSADLKLGLGYLAQPYQRPRPEIVGTVVAPFSKGVIAMGRRDFHPLSANFLMPQWLPSHWANYQEGKAAVGAAADPADWRVARSIFVADDEAVAARYARTDGNSPYVFYFRQLMAKFFKSGRTALFKEDQAQPDHTITVDYVADRLIWFGGVDRIVDHILSLRDQIGDFGELVYAGMDWLDPALARRSMELMATEVMPRVNRAIGAARPAAAAAIGGRR